MEPSQNSGRTQQHKLTNDLFDKVMETYFECLKKKKKENGGCLDALYEVVRYFVEHVGVDINQRNSNGETYLMKCVKKGSTLTEYLLIHGADVNAQDYILYYTALHWAIRKQDLEPTKLLIAHGADPYLENCYGTDAFQKSCMEMTPHIFEFLLSTFKISREHQADVHELMGSSILECDNLDIQMLQVAVKYWRKALAIRYDSQKKLPDIPKKPSLNATLNPSYYCTALWTVFPKWNEEFIGGLNSEFNSTNELQNIATNIHLLRMNSLLVAERVLGSSAERFIELILHRAEVYAKTPPIPYLLCFYLWRHALQLRIQKDTILHEKAGETVRVLTIFFHFVDRNRNRDGEPNPANVPLKVYDLIGTLQQLVDQFPECARLVKVRPVSKGQQKAFDGCLRCCTHLLYLLLRAPDKTETESLQLRKMTTTLVGYGLRMCGTGDTLLHMAVDKGNVLSPNDGVSAVFPSVEVTKYLIECGADVNALNGKRATPLHVAVSQKKTNASIVELLVENKAHLDWLDDKDCCPMALFQSTVKVSSLSLHILDHISLKCIAARAIGKYGITFGDGCLPNELSKFTELHCTMQRDKS